MDAKEVGRRLRSLRGSRTRRAVCKETGISYSAMGNYETGFRIPTDAHKVILAKYYGVTVEEIFFAENNH